MAFDLVAVGEGGFEAVEKIRHCVLAPLATVLEYGSGVEAARACEDAVPPGPFTKPVTA